MLVIEVLWVAANGAEPEEVVGAGMVCEGCCCEVEFEELQLLLVDWVQALSVAARMRACDAPLLVLWAAVAGLSS